MRLGEEHGGMGSLYRILHELVFLFKSGTGSHRNNIQLGKFGRYSQAQRIYLDHRQQALERLALVAGPQPSDSGKYLAEDLTDEELTEILLAGGLKKT